MWSDNIKLWIVLIISHTGKSQYVEYYGDPGGIMFPGPIQSSYNQKINYNPQSSECTNCQSSNPQITIARELEAIETVEDFFNFMSNKPGTGRELLLSKRFGDENERSNPITPKPGNCRANLQVVPFRNENTKPSVSYWPSCTRIERCDGCCSSNLLSCQPIKTMMLNFHVYKLEINGEGSVDFHGEEIIPLEKHISCQCLCKMKPEHCKNKQQYVAKDCKCECTNSDEKAKCNGNHSTNVWNPDTCKCECRKIPSCNSGYIFDNQTCRCEKDLEYDNELNRTQIRTGSHNSFRTQTITLPSATDPRRKHKDEDE